MGMIKQVIRSYDIETSYTVAATWGLYDQNVAKVIREPFIMSIAWKDLGGTTQVVGLPDFPLYKKDKFNDKELVQFIADKVFKGANILIAHNGNGFDLKWIYGRFAVHGIPPPEPKKHIDTLLICRNKFKFNSNKLNDLGKYFNLGNKVQTGGIDLWYKCLEESDMDSWNLMKKYNCQDVKLLEKVYLHILPFITNHPNLALMQGELEACPNCGSNNVQKRGFTFTRISKYQRWACMDCNSWHQSILSDEENQIR